MNGLGLIFEVALKTVFNDSLVLGLINADVLRQISMIGYGEKEVDCDAMIMDRANER